jgi:hypothetical protein
MFVPVEVPPGLIPPEPRVSTSAQNGARTGPLEVGKGTEVKPPTGDENDTRPFRLRKSEV